MIDLTNREFGRLKVLHNTGIKTKYDGSYVWHCICECGTELDVAGRSLIRGNTKSCGCLIKDTRRRLPKGIAARNELYSHYKYHAVERGLVFDIDIDTFTDYTQRVCEYCGNEPSQVGRKKTRGNGAYIYNGIDRKDNTKGYTLENIATCCKVCNYAKHIMNEKDFDEWIIKVYNHRKSMTYS